MHKIITLYTFAPNTLYCAKMALFIIIQDRQTQVQAGDAMATTISVNIVTGKVFHCFCL